MTQRELLSVRLCDLSVSISGTWLEERIARVCDELRQRRLRLNPHFWLSDEWFSPSGVPGVALPFYLAHPKLVRLERSQMLEAEGATTESCMRLLRHELGHAMQHAFNLQRRREWQRLFGRASTPYPKAYRPNPASRRFVHNLDAWYAQSHPEEDFAETFAVWLRPRYNWRKRYQCWPALRKLEYVDRLMGELQGQPPRVRSRAKPFSLTRERMTLREYYQRKRAHYSVGFSNAYDRDLKRLFAESAANGHARETAAAFLRRHRREIRGLVAKWTGDYQFTLNQVLDQMIGRCKELGLVAEGSEPKLVLDFAIMLTVHGMNYLYKGREWHAM
ncbi:MAG: putative zinc-binding metallopeptidase [Myxococcales bacterium]|nr:putative zinc-binding metallopeptidase [Myxococcales bacterium]MDD9970425.1 putative zinc-binding metallopeptidase [Myxococcales bacterium]